MDARYAYSPYNNKHISTSQVMEVYGGPAELNTPDKLDLFQTQNLLPQYIHSQTAHTYANDLSQRYVGHHQPIQESRQSVPPSPSNPEPTPVYKDVNHPLQIIKVVTRDEVEQSWRIKCTQLEKQVHELQAELQQYRGMSQSIDKVTYIEDTGRVNQLMSEVDRLNRTMIDLNNEIEGWRKRYTSLENFRGAQDSLEKELERMKLVFRDNENTLQAEIIRLRDQSYDQDRKYNQLKQDHEFLKLNEQRSKEYEAHILNLQTELRKAQLTIQAKEDQQQELVQHLRRYEGQESQYKSQSDDQRKLRQIIDDRNREIDQTKKQYGDREAFLVKELQTWKDKFLSLNREHHKIQEDHMNSQAEIDQLRRERISSSKR